MPDSKKIDDGGPAFPVLKQNAFGSVEATVHGMSLRDWFAGQALVGIMAGLCSDRSRDDDNRPRAFNRVGFDDAGVDAYHAADAMIAARKGGAQ